MIRHSFLGYKLVDALAYKCATDDDLFMRLAAFLGHQGA
jgi:hypothetical protein